MLGEWAVTVPFTIVPVILLVYNIKNTLDWFFHWSSISVPKMIAEKRNKW
jgi:hypothetical protein